MFTPCIILMVKVCEWLEGKTLFSEVVSVTDLNEVFKTKIQSHLQQFFA